MNKIKTDRRTLIIGITILGAFVILIITVLLSNRVKNYETYTMDIRIETVNVEDIVKNYTLKFKTDGKYSVIEASHISSTIYLKQNTLTYKEGSRFKKISSKNNYGNTYELIASIPLKNEILNEGAKRNFNPEIDKKKVNSIIESLALGKTTNKAAAPFIALQDGVLKEFSMTIDDIEGYKSINILISFEKTKKTDKIEVRKIYKELTDTETIEKLFIL